jgi:beta-lactamase regulating signal transducer with metallopeptidase domain
MTFNSSLSAESAWMTYFVRIALGYLVTWALCAVVQRPAVCSRLWRCFLLLTVAGWLVLLAPAPDRARGSITISSTISSTVAGGGSALRWSLPVAGAWAHRLDSLWIWATRFYLVILALSLLQMFLRWLRLEAFRQSGQLPSPELSLVFHRLRREMDVGGCQLIVAKQLRSPGTAGWYRPHIFLPTEMVPGLSGSQLLDILRHELIHVRRRDYLSDQLAALACRLVCFHPAAWLAHRQLRWETELACDQEVVAGRTESRLLYAECLTNMARWQLSGQAGSVKGIGFASSASLLATRVRALLREPCPHSLFQQVCRTGAVALMVLPVVFLLPGVGLTMYWSVPHAFVNRPSGPQRHPAPRLRAAGQSFRTRTQRALSVQPAEMRGVDAAPNQLSSLFANMNAPPMPVLANSSMSGGDGARSASAPNENGETGSRDSDPIWNQSSSTDAAPSWGDVANTAVRVGVSLTPGGGGSHSGRPDRDPDPRRFP